MPPILFETFGNYYMILISGADAVLYGFGYAFLILMVMYLANKPQPTPRWTDDEKGRRT